MLPRMPVRPRGRFGAVLLALLVCACGASTTPSSLADASPSPSAAGPSGEDGSLPQGCQPIDINAPTGEPIALDGEWVAEEHTSSLPETWWILTLGDCLWGAGAIGGTELFEGPDRGRVQTIRGKIGRDFVVEGEIVEVGTQAPGFNPLPSSAWSPLRLFIEFEDDGTIVLREDRVRGEPGPRCPEPTYSCIPVLVLRPAEETAE
jgi:hypothetical protein